ncbi:MAG: NfeD family protein [Oscillospiraceae bacterium]|nr:NfeD family protein [Oscillospiraceae bacterium]
MLALWIVLLVLTLVLEAATFYLVSVWFAVGALAALIAYALGAGTTVQLTVFIAVSAVLVIFTRPIIKKALPNGYTPTNGERDIGRKAVVTEKIDANAGTGRVKIGDVYWGAHSADDTVIEIGETVVIKEKGGAVVTVERV